MKKKIFLEALIVISIIFLLFSLLFSTSYFLWEKRSIIAKGFGVELKDDCRLYFGKLECSYVKIKKEKKFDINLNNVIADFDVFNFFKRKPFLKIKIDNGKAFVKIEKERKKIKKIKSNPFYYPFFLIYFVKSEINRLDISILLPDERKIEVSNFSFSNITDRFFNKRPFKIVFNGFSADIVKLQGHIHPDSITLDKSIAYINKNILKIYRGSFDYKGNYFFNGRFYGDVLNISSALLSKFSIDFDLQKNDLIKKGNLRIKVSSAIYKNAILKKVNFKLYFDGKRKISGKYSGSIERVSIKDVLINQNLISGKFEYLKNISSLGSIHTKNAKLKNISINNVGTQIKIVLGKDFTKVSGYSKTGPIKVSFDYRNGFLNLSLDRTKILDIYKTLSLKNQIFKNFRGEIIAKAKIDLKNNHTSLNGSIYNPNIFGLLYKTGLIYADINNKNITGSYTVNLNKSNGNVFLNGSFNKGYIIGDLTFENLDVGELIYGKKFKFGGILDGTGHYEGNIPYLDIKIEGTAQNFYYDTIRLKNIQYIFTYNSTGALSVKFKKGKQLNGNFSLNFNPFSIELDAYTKNADLKPLNPYLKGLLPKIFNKISLLSGSGHFSFALKNKYWRLNLDFPNGKVSLIPVKDSVNVSLKGYIDPKERNLDILFSKKDLKVKDYLIGKIKGSVKLKNEKGYTKVSAYGLNTLDKMELSTFVNFDLSSRYISGNVKLLTLKDRFKNQISSNFAGVFKSVRGIINEKGYFNNKVVVKTFVDYSLSILDKYLKIGFYSRDIDIFLPQKFRISFMGFKGNISIPYDKPAYFSGNIDVGNFTVSKNYLYFFESRPFKVSVKDGNVKAEDIRFSGIVNGTIKEFIYSSKKVFLYSEGSIDKNLLSILLKYANTTGNLFYVLEYKGDIKDILKNLSLKIYSENLEVKLAYTIGVTQFKKFLLDYKKGKFNLDINGKCSGSTLGECTIGSVGNGDLVDKYYTLFLKSKFFPFKYLNIVTGNINSDIKIKSIFKNGILYHKLVGKVNVLGRIKLEKNIQDLLKKNQRMTKKNKKLERILLDLSVKSYVPIYIYGSWGKAYGEMDFRITGTADSPIVNGNISIIYGNIYFMKNKYNIDFANIKIINNEPYISARISTSISDTFIFIDISGSLLSPNINFSSIPPKSKDEILSILLLKNTPSALENMPILQVVGKIIYTLFPFKAQEERGLFNTGFEISIIPQYSPSTGISASIYAKRNLTRRIFIALSKPLGQIEEGGVSGWYSFGIRLKEKTSFQYKWFETNNQEFDIVFSFPFDF